MRLSFHLLEKQINAFNSKTFVLFENRTNRTFFIGDEPVVLHNANDLSPYSNLGIMSPGIQIYMPLSPELLIGIWCPSHKQGMVDAIKKYDMLKALSIIGTPNLQRTAADDIKMGRDAFERIKYLLDIIDTGSPLLVDSENVEFFNSLQVMYAERYLMSNKQDFALAQRMIKENGNFKYGTRFTID